MKIFSTFDGQYQGVYIAKFISDSFYKTPKMYETELDKIQDQLQDPLYVRKFINSSKSGWKKGNYSKYELRDLVSQVLKEAADLFDKFDELNEKSKFGNCFEVLFDEFKELSPKERYDDPGRRKMYSYDYGSLLRMYGVRLGNNSIIVTGASIKLVDKMDTEPLLLELKKMDHLIRWLKDNNISTTDDLQII